ncbi:hypothetical protein LCGC14_2771180, partial [marine sediment metagenome]
FMIDKGEAQSIDVTGEFLNVFSIGWIIVIMRPTAETIYNINWDKGVAAISAQAA